MARILIADDDAQVLQVIGTLLKGAGHQVYGATDGEAALGMFQKERPEIAILDVGLPKKAGQAVCFKIKREFPSAQVLLISGVYTDPGFIKDAPAKFKNDGFLPKPFTQETLMGALGPLLAAAAEAPPPAAPELVLGEPVAAPAATAPKAAGPWPNRAAAPMAAPPPSAPKPDAKPAGSPWPNRAAAPAAPPPPSAPKPAAKPAGAPWPNRAAAPTAPPPPSAPKPPPAAAPSPARPAAPAAASGSSQTLGPQPSFAVEGSLEKFSVIALLYRCWSERLFGKLTFKKDVATKEVFVRDGKLVHAASNLDTDKLDHKLLSLGKISGDQYADLQVLAKGMGGVEAALVQLKIVPGAEVFELTKSTALSLVLEVFKWLGGRYVFVQGAASTGPVSLDLPLEDLIKRGLSEAFDRERLEKGFGGRLRAPASKDLARVSDVEGLKLPPAEFRLSRMIDAKKTPEAIAKEWSGGDAAKELRALQVLYLMTEAGMLRFGETQETKKAAAEIEGLKTKLAQIEKADLWQMLGVKENASVAEVKKAYFALAKQFHPDTLPTDAPAEARRYIDQIFAKISHANQVLQDPKQREEYMNEQAVGGSEAAEEAEKILAAEVEFTKGEFYLLKKRDLAAAEKHLTEAMKLNPKEAEHHVLWGWLVYLKSKNEAQALRHIQEGLKLRENVASAYLFIGHIHKAKNEMDKAEKSYKKVLQLDEKNNEAMSELRLMAMRKGKR